MSPKQYTMLGQFVDHGSGMEDITHLNQVTLGSLLYRKWVKQRQDWFEVTNDGRQAYYSYGTQDILRKSFSAALSRYVRPVARVRRAG